MTPDRIFLHDHVVEVEIGAFQQERGILQRIRFAVDVEIDPLPATLDDDVDRILSYDRISEAIGAELATGRLNLLETLAENVASRILAAPQAARVTIRIEKLDRGPFVLGVEISRSRAQVQAASAAPIHPRIVIGHLPDGATGTIVVPELPSAVIQVTDCEGQRQIDLLGLGQAAWALVARDPRLTVAATRTEIDWAIRRGHSVVWAPARMVLDAVDGPAAHDTATLAAWLGRQFVSPSAESPRADGL